MIEKLELPSSQYRGGGEYDHHGDILALTAKLNEVIGAVNKALGRCEILRRDFHALRTSVGEPFDD